MARIDKHYAVFRVSVSKCDSVLSVECCPHACEVLAHAAANVKHSLASARDLDALRFCECAIVLRQIKQTIAPTLRTQQRASDHVVLCRGITLRIAAVGSWHQARPSRIHTCLHCQLLCVKRLLLWRPSPTKFQARSFRVHACSHCHLFCVVVRSGLTKMCFLRYAGTSKCKLPTNIMEATAHDMSVE